MLVKISSLEILTEATFYAAHPNISFPSPLSDAILTPYYAVLNPTTPPVYDSWAHRLVEGTPEQRDGQWYQVWTLEPVVHTPEEEAERARQQADARTAEIKSELDRIDAQSMRPARAVYLALSRGDTPAPADEDKVAGLEAQAVALRTELQSLAV